MPCTLGHMVRRLKQKSGDINCFFWSIIIALKLPLPGLSYDRIEAEAPASALHLIQKLRTEIVSWWEAQPPQKKYSHDRRWMVTRARYHATHYMQIADTIANATAAQDTTYTEWILGNQTLVVHPTTNEEIAEHISRLYDELQRYCVIPQHRLANGYYLISSWLNDSSVFNAQTEEVLAYWIPPSTTVEQKKRVQGGGNVPKSFKYVFAKLVQHETDVELERVESVTTPWTGTLYFDKGILDDIGRMNVRVASEEYIAISAMYHKIILEFPLSHVQHGEDELVRAYGVDEETPDMPDYLTWSDAKQYIHSNRAIMLVVEQGHNDPVCAMDVPPYLLPTQRSEIRESGRVLRSVCIFKKHWLLPLEYALTLTSVEAENYPCCRVVKENDAIDWALKHRAQCNSWWRAEENQPYIVAMHQKFRLSFVVHNNEVANIDDDAGTKDNYSKLDDKLSIDWRKFDAFASQGGTLLSVSERPFNGLTFRRHDAVVSANVLQKVVFVVRDEDDITGYGGPLVTFTASWDDVMRALHDGSGVCCFTATSTELDDFEVTHVVVSLCNVSDDTSTRLVRQRYTGSTNHSECPRCTQPTSEPSDALARADEPLRWSYLPLTLDDVDLLTSTGGTTEHLQRRRPFSCVGWSSQSLHDSVR